MWKASFKRLGFYILVLGELCAVHANIAPIYVQTLMRGIRGGRGSTPEPRITRSASRRMLQNSRSKSSPNMRIESKDKETFASQVLGGSAFVCAVESNFFFGMDRRKKWKGECGSLASFKSELCQSYKIPLTSQFQYFDSEVQEFIDLEEHLWQEFMEQQIHKVRILPTDAMQGQEPAVSLPKVASTSYDDTVCKAEGNPNVLKDDDSLKEKVIRSSSRKVLFQSPHSSESVSKNQGGTGSRSRQKDDSIVMEKAVEDDLTLSSEILFDEELDNSFVTSSVNSLEASPTIPDALTPLRQEEADRVQRNRDDRMTSMQGRAVSIKEDATPVGKSPMSSRAVSFQTPILPRSTRGGRLFTPLSEVMSAERTPKLRTPKSSIGFRRVRDEIARNFYDELNQAVFNDALPKDLEIRWTNSYSKTAGVTSFKLRYDVEGSVAYTAAVELSGKVVDSEDRLRSTLAHEICHVAQWVLDRESKPPHGNSFKKWAELVESYDPLLKIDTCHTYDINYKFRYRCVDCGCEYGRQTNSIDINEKACGECSGRLEALQTPRPATGFAAFIQRHFMKARIALSSEESSEPAHGKVMALLSKMWNQRKVLASYREDPVSPLIDVDRLAREMRTELPARQ